MHPFCGGAPLSRTRCRWQRPTLTAAPPDEQLLVLCHWPLLCRGLPTRQAGDDGREILRDGLLHGDIAGPGALALLS